MSMINKKDPNGLIRNDVLHLKSIFNNDKGYLPSKDDIAAVMYREGQLSVVRYIENEMVAKRTEDYGLNVNQ